ncbi:hypothetical protein [Moorena producens]|uniref:hypothetical protein n=1 Tax=Moorena producens TaxID=1155739 RepID=UPI001314DF76|nr:hypothetical protein [Moorena producens]
MPLASCLPLLGGVRGGSSMPLASCLLILASCLSQARVFSELKGEYYKETTSPK